MAVPTRRQKSLSNLKQKLWADDHKREEAKAEEKPLTEEEHKARLDKLYIVKLGVGRKVFKF